MNSYGRLLRMIRDGTPFCFVRFNDGEMKGVRETGVVVARGHQRIHQPLRQKLIEALQFRGENYWIGKPCPKCFRDLHDVYQRFVESDYPYQAFAVVLINQGRWLKSSECLRDHARNVYWIGGKDQTPPFPVIHGWKVPTKNAWAAYPKLKGLTFPSKSTVLLSCGPLSRVLGYEYWKRQRGDLTVIDIGSLMDPITKGRWLRCHFQSGGVCGKHCPKCNGRIEDPRLTGASKTDILSHWRQSS